ncbi:hypothetical protein JTB14_000710 [Gonioctena quinquepunctata]|nr:hypothetical protein JTB14_000710 [Gonioctena quinquepunctata]
MDVLRMMTKAMRGIMKSVCPEVNLNNLEVFRVGKKNSERSRPIKAVLPSHKEVRSVFFKAKEVFKKYHTIALGFDKTLKQIAEYKELKSEMDRIGMGESNLKIKYIEDVPRIITVPGNQKN